MKSLVIALAMYSRIPVPSLRWDEHSLKYALCYFPAVGVIQGIVLAIAIRILGMFGDYHGPLLAALTALIPYFVTGGLHLQGFVSTSDALGSKRDRAAMLGIMNDPHVGIYGVLALVAYFLVTFAACSTVSWDARMVICYTVGSALSRALSALSLLLLPNLKQDVLWSASDRGKALEILLAVAAACVACLMLMGGFAMVTGAAASSLWYLLLVRKKFSGVTMATSGYFVCMSELMMLTCAALGKL